MNLILTVDHHFVETPDGRVWCKTIHDQLFWKRYTKIYAKVFIVCRYKKTNSFKDVEGWLLSSSENIFFVGVSDFIGPIDFFKKRIQIRKKLKHQLDEISDLGEFVSIYRLPSTVGLLAYSLMKNEKKYAVELVADASTVYRKKGSLLHEVISIYYTLQVKKICKHAIGVAYVTKKYLQKKFPTSGIETSYSSGGLQEKFYYEKENVNECIEFVHVSQINNSDKGHDTFLRALSKLKEAGFSFRCKIIGDGRSREIFEKLTIELGLSSNILFLGSLSSLDEIRHYLIQSDIFLFPSRSEGLPRAVIEAMGCSLLVIASPVGGIPELIDQNYLIDCNDIDGYFEKMKEVLENQQRILIEGRKNFIKALEYSDNCLEKKRTEFYTYLSKFEIEGSEL